MYLTMVVIHLTHITYCADYQNDTQYQEQINLMLANSIRVTQKWIHFIQPPQTQKYQLVGAVW